MKAGFAERDITPELGMEKPGGYGKAFLSKFHDPCKVRAAVFDDGETRVALVGIDALITPAQVAQDAREQIQATCGIAPECVMIGASHSHSAGPVGMVQPGEYDHGSDLVQHLAYEKSSCANADYLDLVRRQIVAAVCAADQDRVDALACVGVGHEDRIAFNRRFRMKDGLTFTHPGKGNPNIVEPAGPIDPEVGVIGAWDVEGRFLGCVLNYACHGTTGPGGTSADWIYYLEQTVLGVMGTGVVVFLNGACGDVTQVDNLSPRARESGAAVSRRVGQCVGAEALKVLCRAQPGELGPVAGSQEVLKIKRRPPSPERLARCTEIATKDPSECDSTEWTFAKEIVMLDAIMAKAPVADVEVQAIQVGPAVFLSNPAEFFCQLGLDIKAGSPFPFTFPVELANACVGYVPTEEALGEHGGGYETRLSSYTNLEPAAGPQIVDASIRLAAGLTPGAVPEEDKAPAWATSWRYGSLPPELE